jgi:hypothetical protein
MAVGGLSTRIKRTVKRHLPPACQPAYILVAFSISSERHGSFGSSRHRHSLHYLKHQSGWIVAIEEITLAHTFERVPELLTNA